MEETKIIEISQRVFLLIGGFMVIIAIFMVGELMYQFSSLPQNTPQEISVSGQGKAYAKPDIALVSFGAHSESIKSQDAVNQNNTIINAVIASVKKLGVADKDIQTTSYNLNPLYDYTERGRIFKGYALDQQIQVKIRNFDKISDILDAVASDGANTIGDLQFTLDDMNKVNAEARAKAIAQAKEKADSLIGQAGLQIEKLVNIEEGYNAAPQPMYNKAVGMLAGTATVAPQIQTGQLEVDSTVTLTYRVK